MKKGLRPSVEEAQSYNASGRGTKALRPKPKRSTSSVVAEALTAQSEARDVAKDLRRLAAVFDETGPGHAAILRGFARRLDGNER
jgi:hypothetical protein